MNRIPRLQIVFDALHYQFYQITVGIHQHGNEQVALKIWIGNISFEDVNGVNIFLQSPTKLLIRQGRQYAWKFFFFSFILYR